MNRRSALELFLKSTVASLTLSKQSYSLPVNNKEKGTYEIFASTREWSPCFSVVGVGNIGKDVINACETHHLDGLQYVSFDGIESETKSYQRLLKKADLSFIIASTQDLNGIHQASLISSSIANSGGTVVTLLSSYSGGLDENSASYSSLKTLLRHSKTVIDFPDYDYVSNEKGRLFYDSMVNSQCRAIEMLTQPLVGRGVMGMDVADIKLMLSMSPYMRCASVLVDIKENDRLQHMLENIYDAKEEKLNASFVSVSVKSYFDKYDLMLKFGDDVNQVSTNDSMQLLSQVVCADEKQSTYISLLVAVKAFNLLKLHKKRR